MLFSVRGAMAAPALQRINTAVLAVAAEEAGAGAPLRVEEVGAAAARVCEAIESLLCLGPFLNGGEGRPSPILNGEDGEEKTVLNGEKGWSPLWNGEEGQRPVLDGEEDPAKGSSPALLEDEASLAPPTGVEARGSLIPPSFFDQNEASFRGLLRPGRAPVESRALAVAAAALNAAVGAQISEGGEVVMIPEGGKGGGAIPEGWGVAHAVRDNDIVFYRLPVPRGARARSGAAAGGGGAVGSGEGGSVAAATEKGGAGESAAVARRSAASSKAAPPSGVGSKAAPPSGMEPARDRLGRRMEGRFSTPAVREARLGYLRACVDMEAAVRREMQVCAWVGIAGRGRGGSGEGRKDACVYAGIRVRVRGKLGSVQVCRSGKRGGSL
jgi:hypothetical protein